MQDLMLLRSFLSMLLAQSWPNLKLINEHRLKLNVKFAY